MRTSVGAIDNFLLLTRKDRDIDRLCEGSQKLDIVTK